LPGTGLHVVLEHHAGRERRREELIGFDVSSNAIQQINMLESEAKKCEILYLMPRKRRPLPTVHEQPSSSVIFDAQPDEIRALR
jgi:hypothetical protein